MTKLAFEWLIDEPTTASSDDATGDAALRVQVAAGGIVSGRLKITSANKPVKISDGIDIFLCGQEHIQYTVHKSYSSKMMSEKREFIKVPGTITAPIAVHVLDAGSSHEIPFTVGLPSNIPPSMHINDNRESQVLDGKSNSATLSYVLKAVQKGSGLFKNNPEDSAELKLEVLAEKAKKDKPELYDSLMLRRKVTSLATDQGEITVGVSIQGKQFSRNQRIELQLSGINESLDTEVKSIEVGLEQDVRGKVKGKKYPITSKTLSCATFESLLITRTRGKEELKQRVEQQQQQGDDEEYKQKIRQEIILGLGSASYLYQLPPIPDTALNSYQGRSFAVNHEIAVTLETEDSTEYPVCRIPVKIVGGGDRDKL